jgi:hypothetical protein
MKTLRTGPTDASTWRQDDKLQHLEMKEVEPTERFEAVLRRLRDRERPVTREPSQWPQGCRIIVRA